MIATLLQHYRYFIIVPLTLVEGPIVMMVGGLLLRLDYFSFWPLYLTLVFSDFAADVIWYSIGFFYGDSFVRRFGKYFSLTPPAVAVVKKLFRKYEERILIISKLTTGLGFAVGVIFTAGLVKVPFHRYAAINFLGGFAWTGILLSVGYFLGDAYTNVNNVIGKLSIIAMIMVIIAAMLGFANYLKKRTIRDHLL